MKLRFALITLTLFSLAFTSCDKDEDEGTSEGQLSLDISGLEDLGSDYAYEGWIMVDGAPQTTGVFTVDSEGTLSQTSFDIDQDDLDAATAFILTVEPSPDADPSPSSVHILAGDFSSSDATLSIDHGAALGTAFADVAGEFILASPTDDDDTNEASGVWFLNNSGANGPVAGLTLPTLPTGWAYEGWAMVDGTPVSTGVFSATSGADGAGPYNGPNAAPPYPGEDFLFNAPAGSTFPTDLTGGAAVISVEPVPDNSPAPFVLKPLVGMIPAGADVHSVLTMGQNLTFPTGSVSR